MILGQALFFADERLLLYAAAVWLAFSAFVIIYEEPVLLRTFGAEYANYRAHVGRWLPRLTPWRPD
jgi:protein-S-isoprenylcysteine O-methyltransferase Ste14